MLYQNSANLENFLIAKSVKINKITDIEIYSINY